MSNIMELKKDLREFERKFRLAEFFHDKEESDFSLVKNKSEFMPDKGRNKYLDTYFENLWNTNFSPNNNIPKNLSFKQRTALKELQNDSKIIIKEADKGSAVVIMDKEYYRENIQNMLNNTNNYELMETNKDKNVLSKIIKLCNKYDNVLTSKERKYLVDFNTKTSNFYGLPKIHKSEIIKNAIQIQQSEYIEIHRPKDLKFRPIVAGPSCPTHRLSNLIDILLQPFLKEIKSFVRDDIDFLCKIPTNIDSNTILTTFDVSSLYSNIPHDLGREAISYWVSNFPFNLHHRFTEEFIIDAIDIILNNNTFQFDDKQYVQILGTAMGTKMAPTYATLILAFLENKLYEIIEQQYNSIIMETFKTLWKRYLDDCFIIWNLSWGNIDNLYDILQNLHPNITFTMEKDPYKIAFLDIMLIKENNKLITDIYRKPTDTQQYLHFKSQHPKSCRNSIPYTLARRICTIIVPSTLRKTRLDELRYALKERGYPLTLINKGIGLAESIPLPLLRQTKEKDKNQPLAFVTTYNKCNPEIFNQAHKGLENLRADQKLNQILNERQIIKSKRQPKCLKQLLTRAYFSNNEHSNTFGVTKCNNKRCKVCDIIIEGPTFKFKNSSILFHIKRNLNCSSKNVIYVILCENCKEEYIGCTQSLNHRVALHKSNIKLSHNRNLFVSKHIFQCSKGKFKIMPIYQTDNYSDITLKEQDFIDKFKPLLNRT